MRVEGAIAFALWLPGATSPMFVYGEPAGRVILVRAALFFLVEEAAQISRESVPNDGGVIKEHDGSMSEGGILPGSFSS